MNRTSLLLSGLALVLLGGAAWLSRERGHGDRPEAFGRQAQGREAVASGAPDTDEVAELDALESPFWREDVRALEEGRSEERDDLSSDSPAPPEPGAYDGELAREYYDDGTLLFEAQQTRRADGVWEVDGRWNSYHANGQMQESGFYAQGVEDGDWSWWDENGQQIAHGNFVEGRREGAWTFWYPTGVKQMDARYEAGEGAGNWMLYYEDGSPWARGQYIDGEISGPWTIWDEFGELDSQRTGMYEHGQRVSD